MKRKKEARRILSLCVAVFVLISLTMSVYAQLSDISGHYAAEQISKWVKEGIINGNPDGTYAPNRAISRAEFSSILCKLFNLTDKSENKFTDVGTKDWYYDVVTKAATAGFIKGNKGKFRPNEPISRQEAAIIIYRAFILKVKDNTAVKKYVDADKISSWAKEAVNSITENGYMAGRPGSKFDPLANVTRAEAVKIVDNIVEDLQNTAGTYTGTFQKSVVINTGDITLKDAVINGDLILAQGIADGTVNLDNVVVKGRTLVLGGGENSIILTNTSIQGSLVVIKKDGKVRIVAKGTTNVAEVQLNSGAKLQEEDVTGEGFENVEVIEIMPGQQIILDGDYEEVKVAASDVDIEVTEGTIGNLEISKGASGTNVEIASGATVTTLTANAKVEVTGQGTIETANINADDVIIEQTPVNIILADDVVVTVGGEEITETATTPTPTTTTPAPAPPPAPTTGISSVSLTKVGGGSIASSASGSTYTFNLTTEDAGIFINGLNISSSPVATRLVVSDVTNQVTSADANGIFGFSGNGSIIDAFLGTSLGFDGDVSIQTIRSILSGTLTRNVSVYSGSTLVGNITLTFIISNSGDTLGTQSLLNCYSISASSGTITATLKSGMESQPVLTGGSFYQLLRDIITVPAGYSFAGVDIGTSNSGYTNNYITNDVTILQNLAAQVDKVGQITQITLGHLKTKQPKLKVKAIKASSADIVVTVIFA